MLQPGFSDRLRTGIFPTGSYARLIGLIEER
jgi:hypothetical protein